MKKLLILFLVLLMLVSAAVAESPLSSEPAFDGSIVASYDSPSLAYTVEKFQLEGAVCYLSTVWMQDPAAQIGKATSEWHTNLMLPSDMADRVGETARLVINGSGYVTKNFPEIPDSYPGTSEDYYFEPLGSLTVTNGKLYRRLKGIPFYGLTLQKDGLHLHVGDDPEALYDSGVQQTWSFYEDCPMNIGGQSILNEEWTFAQRKAMRTIIMKLDDHTYAVLTVTDESSLGLALITCNNFIIDMLCPEWTYDLDGGPSSALLVREDGSQSWRTLHGNKRGDVDIMAFCVLPE